MGISGLGEDQENTLPNTANAALSDSDEILDALDEILDDMPHVKAMLLDVPEAEQLTGAEWAKAALRVRDSLHVSG